MDGIIIKKGSRTAEYEELLMERDRLRKAASIYLVMYIHEFGELMTELFSQKIQCISLKRSIAFCQKAENHRVALEKKALDEFMHKELSAYYEELERMIDENEHCRILESSTAADVEKSKLLYRKISRMIHPDMNPAAAEDEKLSDLWNRAVSAYHANDVKELSEIEILAARMTGDIFGSRCKIEIPDLDLKTAEIRSEIEKIKTTDPYCYRFLLEDPEAVEAKKEALRDEIRDYVDYASELQNALDSFAEKGVLI